MLQNYQPAITSVTLPRYNLAAKLRHKIRLSIVFISIFLFVLHPYTIYGKPGVLVAFVFAFYALNTGVSKAFAKKFVLPSVILLAIAFVGTISSYFNDIFQLNHLTSVVSLLVIVLASLGIARFSDRSSIPMEKFLYFILLAIVLNSLLIIVEVQYDATRQLIEGYLQQFEGGAIDYSFGYRLRGLASSGGAGLSISIPAALIIALYLFNKKKINRLQLLLTITVLFTSLPVIGRSGIILSAIPLGCYLALILGRSGRLIRKFTRIILFALFVILIGVIGYTYFSEYYSSQYDEAFVNYAFGFLLEENGFENEGTTSMVIDFLTVFPTDFPQVLTGYGFYGGSAFDPWTDSGISRTFLSVGIPLGLVFYLIILSVFLINFRKNKFLIGTFVLLLASSEVKEPLMFSGVASRMFILILVFIYYQRVKNDVGFVARIKHKKD